MGENVLCILLADKWSDLHKGSMRGREGKEKKAEKQGIGEGED